LRSKPKVAIQRRTEAPILRDAGNHRRGKQAGNVIAAAIQRTHEDRSNIRSQAAVESPARRVPSRSKTAIWVEPGVADRS